MALSGLARGRGGRLLALALALGVAAAAAAAEESPTRAPEAAVKAGFLFNFARFVEWRASEACAPGPMVLWVMGDDDFARSLEQVVRGKTIDARSVEVRKVSAPAQVGPCSVVFLADAAASRLPEIAAAARGRAVLTVGESGGFAPGGGAIGLLLEDGRMRFEVNPAAARAAGVKLSSRLLGLARVLRAGDGERPR